MQVLIGAILDLIFADPYFLYHPVQAMGSLISWEEGLVRRWARTPSGLRLGGLVLALFNICLVFVISSLGLKFLPSPLSWALGVYMVYTSLSARMLSIEARKVARALDQGLEEGRAQVQNIVGRDASFLSREEVIKATVETVAENSSDGVIAPLFFILILGPAGGWTYKMVNTMDSMLGYRDEKYIDLGRYPAIIDDIFNWAPARITGLLMCLTAFGTYPVGEGFRILKRDRRNHLSPNAGYPEAALAGLLGIKLGGGHSYGGHYVHKPSLGEAKRPVELADIGYTIDIMYRTGFIFLVQVLLIQALWPV